MYMKNIKDVNELKEEACQSCGNYNNESYHPDSCQKTYERGECSASKIIGRVIAYMSFDKNYEEPFILLANINGVPYRAHGSIWDDAVVMMKANFRKTGLRGHIVVHATDEAKKNKLYYYYKPSSIPGDAYHELITRDSSWRDKCRSLCD